MSGWTLVPPTPVVEVGRVERDAWGDSMEAEVRLDGEVVAIATKATDCPMPSWIVFIEAPDAPAWMLGTVEAGTIRELRTLVREHVVDAHRRMVDAALAEACQHAVARAEIAASESMSGGYPCE